MRELFQLQELTAIARRREEEVPIEYMRDFVRNEKRCNWEFKLLTRSRSPASALPHK